MGGGISVFLYLLCIGVYTRISKDPIIFFASLCIAIGTVVIVGLMLWKSRLFDYFTLTMIGFVYLMGIIILTTFGPTFIDRSISYHIAFYAVDQKEVDINEIRQEFSEEIFNKRIHDAIETGFIEESDDDYFTPTFKAKFMTAVLKPIGRLTNSLNTYEALKEKLAE